jgi:hypothetical protein
LPPVIIDNPIPCQIEALDTAILIAGVAGHRQPWLENNLREDGLTRNYGLARIAFMMATGWDKTAVTAVRIASQELNKRSDLHAECFANGRSGSASQRTAVPRDQDRQTDELTA